MLKLKNCCKVPFPEKLVEQYEVNNNAIYANIGTDKIKNILLDFIEMHNEWLFFILEIPTKWDDEPKDDSGNPIGIHKDVYYIDGCTQDKAKSILLDIGDLLIDDGMSSFGFGCHNSKEEIIFDKYNLLVIYTDKPEQYEYMFSTYDIPKTDNLITAWSTFDVDNYGECKLNVIDDKDIYSIPAEYENQGMYFAERREC